MIRAALLAVAMFLAASPALAQEVFQIQPSIFGAKCADIGLIDGWLRKKEHEAPVMRGLEIGGGVMQLYRGEDGDSWSITIVFPNGPECFIFGGEALQDIPWRLDGKNPT